MTDETTAWASIMSNSDKIVNLKYYENSEDTAVVLWCTQCQL